jgi:hypothetical protein
MNAHLELNLTKVVDNATERVKEAQDTAQRQIQQLRKGLDEKRKGMMHQ